MNKHIKYLYGLFGLLFIMSMDIISTNSNNLGSYHMTYHLTQALPQHFFDLERKCKLNHDDLSKRMSVLEEGFNIIATDYPYICGKGLR